MHLCVSLHRKVRIRLFPEDFRQLHSKSLTAQAAGEDSAVGGEEDDMGDASDMVGIGGNLLCVDNLRVGNAVAFDGHQRIFGLVLCGNAENLKALVFIFVVSGNDLRDFHSAGAAP